MFTRGVWTFLHILENVGVVARKYQYRTHKQAEIGPHFFCVCKPTYTWNVISLIALWINQQKEVRTSPNSKRTNKNHSRTKQMHLLCGGFAAQHSF